MRKNRSSGGKGGGFMAPGRMTADQLREGEPFELSNGRLVECQPAGARGARANLVGASVLDTDPAVKSAAVDAGFSPHPKMMRAPDISVGDIPNEPGWAPGAPPLAVEYADVGQDEVQLKKKIKELFAAGTKFIWVVRMAGPRRVEVYENGAKMRIVGHTDLLTAPGILENPVPVAAMYDREAAHEATLRNLLQRKGFKDLEEVEARGIEQGIEKGIEQGIETGVVEGQRRMLLRQLRVRFGELPESIATRIGSAPPSDLDVWTDRVLVASTLDDVMA